MERRISMDTRQELLKVVAQRYQSATGKSRATILDEFVAVTGYHRKHALRLLNRRIAQDNGQRRPGHRIYNETVREALTLSWETADRICSKRLKAAIPQLIESMERHGHLDLDDEIREDLITMSPATIDRLLKPVRDEAGSAQRRRRVAGSGIRRRVGIRTFADWDDPPPGYFEADFVAHCGGSLLGSFVHSFMVTDIASGWTDGLPLIVREQTLVVEGLEVLRARLPVRM